MAELLFNQPGALFKLKGTGHVNVPREIINIDLLKALVEQPMDSDFFLPDLCDILDKDSAAAIRDAFEKLSDAITLKKYRGLQSNFVGLQVGQVWDLDKLGIVWRTGVKTILIDEIVRVRDGRAFAILTGSNEILSEEDIYRKTLKYIGDHLDGHAEDAATMAAHIKITLKAPIVGRKVCASDENGAIQTITAWGPSCLDCSQWVMPKGFTFISLEA